MITFDKLYQEHRFSSINNKCLVHFTIPYVLVSLRFVPSPPQYKIFPEMSQMNLDEKQCYWLFRLLLEAVLR